MIKVCDGSFDGVSGIGVFQLNDLVLIDGLVSVAGLRV